jgi:ABC-type glycerol-3-phosphate transport system substrate-binding protein
MTSSKSGLMVASVLGLLLLGACSSGTQTTTSSPEASSTTASAPASSEKTGAATVGDYEKEHGAMSGKGMVVEAGAYHLELMPEKDAGEIHLDLFLTLK